MAKGINKSEEHKKTYIFCYIDCRIDTSLTNDFLNLNIWGKTVYKYVIETAIKSDIFDQIIVVTDSIKIKKTLGNEEGINIQSDFIFPKIDSVICILSGRAVMLRSITIKRAYSSFSGGIMHSSTTGAEFNFLTPGSFKSFVSGYNSRPENVFAFYQVSNGEIENKSITTFHLNPNEAVVINTVNDFELSIVLKKKEKNRMILKNSILERIKEKEEIFSQKVECPSICLVGHSQLDYWEVKDLAGYKVRNCAIAGISSFEYSKYILEKEILNCASDIFVIMHGTNDIVMDVKPEEIIRSISETIYYIRKRNCKAPIYFLSCMHTNGRLDRDNHKIDEINARLKKVLGNCIRWVDTSFMDDGFSELDMRNTVDGLHLNDKGYKVLQKHLETCLLEDIRNEI